MAMRGATACGSISGNWLAWRVPSRTGGRIRGVPAGARGQTVLVGSVYGSPSGVLGLRLFPNPDFRDAAETQWDPVRYYTDAAYYGSRDLVRPYRVDRKSVG